MMNDLKQRGLYAHREFLLWIAVTLMCLGSFAAGVGCTMLAGGCT